MAKGENIFRRRDGRWEARYSKGRELSGKIKYGYCYGKTYREAKEKAEKVQSGVSKRKSLANIQDSKSVFRLLYGVASRKEKQGERINIYQV